MQYGNMVKEMYGGSEGENRYVFRNLLPKSAK